MQSTTQQLAISSSELKGITKVTARAGTGKTTTLQALAVTQAYRGNSGLYLAFNKSAGDEAKRRFPKDWVTTKTINGLAHGVVSPRYKGKFRHLPIKSIEVIRLMSLAWNWGFAKNVLDTLNFWCISSLSVFPITAMSVQGAPMGSPDMLRYAAVVANQLWQRMVDPTDQEVPISHDGVLKLYQLSEPRLSYPYIMLDEGQDTNEVTWDILQRQTSPLVVVGDPYQSIYQFRGAFNAMDRVMADQDFPLSQSFRFGKDVADIANAVLWGFYSETTPIEGLGPDTRIGNIANESQHAVISRTNAAIFSQAVRAMQMGQKIGFIGGVQSYNFGKIVDLWFLQSGERSMIRDQFLKDFESFEDLAEYADNANDMEVKRSIEAVNSYGASVLEIVPAIHASCVRDLSEAQITLSTAHRCKGSTLQSVKLADDFPDLLDAAGQMLKPELLDRQEVNLYYVALSRASHRMQLNQTMLSFLESMGMDVERFNQAGESMALPVQVSPTVDLKPDALPVLSIPAAWLPAGGQAPGSFMSDPGPTPARKPTTVLGERAQKRAAKSGAGHVEVNQIDLFG